MTLTDREHIQILAENLVRIANAWGFVVTIETSPRQPLAMGNYDMVIDVRHARILAPNAEVNGK